MYLYLMPVPYCLGYSRFTVSFWHWEVAVVYNFFFKIVFGIWSPLKFHMNLKIGFSIYEKKIVFFILYVSACMYVSASIVAMPVEARRRCQIP